MQSMPKQVIKRDGSTEPYEESKIVRVVEAAGLTSDQAKELAGKATEWVNTLPEAAISSLRLRDKILELLTAVDPNVADFYRWYQKTKETPRKKV